MLKPAPLSSYAPRIYSLSGSIFFLVVSSYIDVQRGLSRHLVIWAFTVITALLEAAICGWIARSRRFVDVHPQITNIWVASVVAIAIVVISIGTNQSLEAANDYWLVVSLLTPPVYVSLVRWLGRPSHRLKA
jgi:Kef-type K+ transport system membrane component KefB